MLQSFEIVYEKGSRQINLNEDEILIKPPIFGVFDGATSLTGYIDKDGNTGGKLAAQIAAATFSECSSLKNAAAIAMITNARIQRAMERAGIDTRFQEARWATSAAITQIEKETARFFHIGDCAILCLNKDETYYLPAPPHDHEIDLLIAWKELARHQKKTAAEMRGELMPRIKNLRRDANRAYGILNGEVEAMRFFDIGEFSLENIRSILIFSDGLFINKENPKDPDDWPLFVRIYKKGGLQGLLRHIRTQEKSDPECHTYPRPKPHDDVGAIALTFL